MRSYGVVARDSRWILSVAAPFLLLLLAGCGAVNATSGSGQGAMLIAAEKATLDTTTTDQLSARLASGAPANVTWSIVAGQNDASLGQGTISANGRYTPPQLLSRDQVQDPGHGDVPGIPAATASYLLTVTPGFVQVLTPETASMAPGGPFRSQGRSLRSIPALSAGRWRPPGGRYQSRR
jgi:hypothetical protein